MWMKKGRGAGNGSNTKPLAPVEYQPAALRQQLKRGGAAAAVTTTQALNLSNHVRALRAHLLLEAAGVSVPDSPHSICKRCESLMKGGETCSVLVTKSTRGRKPSKYLNCVMTTCHMCTHDNVRPGMLMPSWKTKLAQAAAHRSLETKLVTPYLIIMELNLGHSTVQIHFNLIEYGVLCMQCSMGYVKYVFQCKVGGPPTYK